MGFLNVHYSGPFYDRHSIFSAEISNYRKKYDVGNSKVSCFNLVFIVYLSQITRGIGYNQFLLLPFFICLMFKYKSWISAFLIILCCFLQFPHWAYFMLRFVPPIQVQCLPVYIKTTTIFLKSSVFCYSYYIWRSQWWHCHISHTHIHISWLFPIFPDHLVEWMISMSNHKMTGSVGNFHEHKE